MKFLSLIFKFKNLYYIKEMMQFKEVNGKEILDDLFSTRDKQLEEEKSKTTQEESSPQEQKPKKPRKPRTPKKKN